MTSPLCRWLGRRDSSIKVISQLFGPPYSLLNLDPRASWLLLKINTMLEFQSCALTEKNPSNVPRRFKTGPQNKLLKQFKQQKKCQRSQEGPRPASPRSPVPATGARRGPRNVRREADEEKIKLASSWAALFDVSS